MAKPFDLGRCEARQMSYCLWTEDASTSRVERYVRLRGSRHPAEMDEAEVVEFLTHLTIDRVGPAPAAICGRSRRARSRTDWSSPGTTTPSTRLTTGP